MAVKQPLPAEPRRTVADEVYRALKRDIITLRRPPGAALTEHELAAAYGSSRVPVREACRRLQQEGLVTAIPYKGYFVNRISLREIADCFELRGVLETHAVDSAVRRASADGLARLQELAAIEYTYHDWSSYADFLERNQDFHIQLAGLGGNERLVAVLGDLLGSMQRFFFLGLDLGAFGPEMRREHERLVEALSSGSAAAAVACVQEQIASSRQRVQRALTRNGIDLPIQ
ncbi:MAG: GntR family transcriptional regulator [Acidobacteria bacterium]|nr:GntR family transcriptional regulator [Acidobacteriota bacterium]